MARPGLCDHRKFRRFVHMLNCPVPHARGYLECLWEVGYKDGEALLGDDHDVALAAQYPNQDVPAFVSALADCGGPGCAGFIEKNADGRWMIHDLLENAPSYVQARMRMRRYRHDRHEQHRTNGEPFVTVAQPLRNCCASPSPAPAPAPAPKEDTTGQAQQFELIPTADPPKPPVMVYACQGKPDQWELTEDQLTEWAGDYPVLGREGLLDECRKASAWLKANHLKTAKGMKRFLVNWFSSTVNRKGASHGRSTSNNMQRGLVENLTL